MSSDLPWIQRLAAVDSLAADSESYSFLVNCLEREDNYLLRRGLLVASVRSARTQDQIGFAIRIGLSDPDDEVVSTAVWLYLDFPDCGIALHEFVGRVGIHRSMIPWLERDGGADVCYISAKLRSLFDVSIPEGLCLRDVLAVEYDEAVVHLGRAVRYLKTDPTIFVSSLDNFNHILAIKLSEDFDKKQIPRDKFGNIVDALAHSHPIVSAHFKACHDLRSSCRGAHPWASKYGRWAQDVSYGQRDRLVNGMKIAYQAVLDAFSSRP